MTIYLMVKTHTITGLKYLCKTERDPYKYRGSGKYWKRHIKIHGHEDIDTVIIKECKTHEEVREWGIYYSNLWNVVEAKDENGVKLWANLRPEEGDGMTSDTAKILNNLPHVKQKNRDKQLVIQNNPRVRSRNSEAVKKSLSKPEIKEKMIRAAKNSWQDENIRQNRIAKITAAHNTEESRKKNSAAQLIAQNRPEVIQKQKEAHTGSKNPRYDHMTYTFKHKDGRIEECTRYELYKKYNLHDGSLTRVIQGKLKSTGGWSVL